eukprot:9176132-Lingulodinium_polyedra.AAC.1
MAAQAPASEDRILRWVVAVSIPRAWPMASSSGSFADPALFTQDVDVQVRPQRNGRTGHGRHG